jgi:hypothetical protein
MIWDRTIHAIAVVPTAVAFEPAFDHGDTEEKPMPAPSVRSISEVAVPASAPPIIAAHDKPDEAASFFTVDLKPDCCWSVNGATAGCAMFPPRPSYERQSNIISCRRRIEFTFFRPSML